MKKMLLSSIVCAVYNQKAYVDTATGEMVKKFISLDMSCPQENRITYAVDPQSDPERYISLPEVNYEYFLKAYIMEKKLTWPDDMNEYMKKEYPVYQQHRQEDDGFENKAYTLIEEARLFNDFHDYAKEKSIELAQEWARENGIVVIEDNIEGMQDKYIVYTGMSKEKIEALEARFDIKVNKE